MAALNPTASKQADGSIKVSWTPDPSCFGYRFYRDGVAVSKSTNPGQSTIKFAKETDSKSHTYGVARALEQAPEVVVFPAVPIPPTPAPKLKQDAAGKLTWDPTPGANSYNLWDSLGTPPYSTLGNVLTASPPARPGQTVEYDVEPRKDGVPVGDWYGRVSFQWPGTVPVPPDPPPTGEQIICIETAGWGGSLFPELKAAGIGWFRPNSGGWQYIPQAKAAGMKIAITPFGESGTIGAINPTQYASSLRAFIIQHALPRVEVLNEPEGNWFWTDAGNATAYVNILKAVWAATRDLGCKICASLQDKDGWGDKVIAAGGLPYFDEGIIHPYGGAQKSAASAAGNRQMVINAFNKSNKKQFLSEFGWPTAVGQPATGDSAQWTDAEQAANIVDFCKWIRANPQMISGGSLFHYVDYGSNMFYGIVRKDLSHKPSYAAFAPYAND